MSEETKVEEDIKQEEIKEVEKKQKAKEVKKPKKDKIIKLKESEYIKVQEELAEIKDKHVRLYAEFENARKRMDREKQDFVRYANVAVLLDFLTILDSLELSISTAKDKHSDAEALIKGLELVMSQVHDLLKRNDVKAIETKDKKFDLNEHEVLMQEETDEVEENTIIEEFQKGYKFGDRVLRTAKVKVAKTKS